MSGHEAAQSGAGVRLASSDGELEATVLPHLGMVVASLRHRGEELLALRGGPSAYAERGSTFGIPLLHPWANRLSAWSYALLGHEVTLDPASPVAHRDADTGLPIHGLLAANRSWVVTERETLGLVAELDFAAQPELLAAFPFPHRLRMKLAVDAADQGGSLTVSLRLSPSGVEPVPVAFGFHPYLTLPGSDRRGWTIEVPVRRRVLLDGQGIPTGETEELPPGVLDGPLGERSFDDNFDRLAPGPGGCSVFAVADSRRRIEVRFARGYEHAQMYAPPGSDFICFEPMTAPIDALRSAREALPMVEPGSSFEASFVVAVAGPA